MARQRIGTLEQHFEKGLLVLAALGLLGVVAWQIVGSKNTVKVDKTEGLPLNQGYPKLAEMASRLSGELSAEKPILPEVSKVGLLDEFNRRLTGSVAPVGQLAWNPAPFKLQGLEVAGAMGAERKIAIPGLPTPSKPIALSFMSTIDPEVAAAVRAARADLVPAWPNEAPFDVAAVSVETTIDGAALKAALEKDPDGAGPLAALPKSWWDATQVLALDLVRERQLDGGQWGESTVIGTLPLGLDLLAELNADAVNAERLIQITVEAQQREDEVQRPDFLKRAEMGGKPVGQAWAPPSDAIAGTGVNSEVFALQRSLRALDKKIADLDRAMKGAEKSTTTAAPTTPGRTPTRAPATSTSTSTSSSAGATNLAELKTRIDRATKEREVLAKQLEALGQKEAPAAKNVAVQRDFSTLLTGSAVRVWGHDISVKRGQTYRYQARVHLSNPLFGRSAFMADADAAAGKNPTMTLPDSGWSDSVTVDPENYLFITSASIPQAGNALNRTASASAELYTFTWGYWRTVKVALEPGDPIAGRVLVPDVAKIAAMAAAPEAAPEAAPAAGAKPTAKPAESSLPRKDITVSRDAYLLDVAGVAATGTGIGGSAKTDYQAYVREAQGRISVRRPEAEREDKQYKRVAESAREGEEQIKQGLIAGAAGANQPAGARSPAGEERQPVVPVRPPGGGGG